MVARDLFGPAAEQRVHDRMAEIQRERQIAESVALVASVTWQEARPLTLRDRNDMRQMAAEQFDWKIARERPAPRTTVSTRVANILNKLGLRQRPQVVTQSLPDTLPGVASASDG